MTIKCFLPFLALALLPGFSISTYAAISGSISGTVKDHSGAVVPKATVTATNTDTGVRQVAPNRYLVNRSSLNNDMQDMAKLFTEVRAVPNLQNGSSNGFALSEIQPGSIFDAMGLQDGDVVTNIGGQPTTDPRKTISVLESLQTANNQSIQLTVLRNGAPVNLSYTIR